jgi:hypothetical protein
MIHFGLFRGLGRKAVDRLTCAGIQQQKAAAIFPKRTAN